MIIMHGTSLKAAKDILTNGWNDTDRIWYDSCSGLSYFWADKYIKKHCLDDDCTDEDVTFTQIQYAFDSGYMATVKDKGNVIVVLEYEIDDSYVTPDDSDENMTKSGASQVPHEDLVNARLRCLYVCEIPHRVMLMFVNAYNLKECDINLSDIELEFVKNSSYCDIESYYDLLSNYQTITPDLVDMFLRNQ